MDQETRYRIAMEEMVLSAKYTEANRIYSGKTMWRYLKRRFGSYDAALARMRAILTMDGNHFWPDEERAQRQYVKRKQSWVVEELVYECKKQDAVAMFGSRKRMLRFLTRIYNGNSSHLRKSIQSASRRGRRQTINARNSETVV